MSRSLSWRHLALFALPLAILAASAEARPGPGRLVRTRQVLDGVSHSFVGEPTRAELLAGGLAALVRIAPGTSLSVDKETQVVVNAGGKRFRFKTDEMVADVEVAAAIERVYAAAKLGIPPQAADDEISSALVNALNDRHSAYLRPSLMERLGYSEHETLGDPGVDLELRGSKLAIRSVAPGSAAAGAGIKPGLLVRRIDSHNIEGMCLGEVGAMLLGQAGSSMTLVLEPASGGDPSSYELVRDPPYALQPHFRLLGGYVLHVVPGPLLGKAAAAVRKALVEHQGKLRGVIIDVRGNGGGQVGDAVDLADLFVPDGRLAVVVGREHRPVQRFEGKVGGPGEGVPVVVLVDGRTASATELVALVLRERLKAPLIGSTTYGKGSVQKLLPIAGGGYLKITSAMYSTPDGTTVGDGIAPDVELAADTYPARGSEGALETDAWLKAAHDALPRPPAK